MSVFKQMLGNTFAGSPASRGYKPPAPRKRPPEGLPPLVTGLRGKVLRSLREGGPGAPDEIAERLGLSILSVRPRFSELSRLGLIEQTNERRSNDSCQRAGV